MSKSFIIKSKLIKHFVAPKKSEAMIEC